MTIDPTFVEIENLTDSVSIGVVHRWVRIEEIYGAMNELPDAVRAQVQRHRTYMASGQPVDAGLPAIVSALSSALVTAAPSWLAGSDPLPALELLLGIRAPLGPTLPPPNEIGEEEPLASARSAHQYRLAKTRGASGRKFSAAVREAYDNRCMFCGAKYGGVSYVRSGVDAAHILAWSKYDLDIVSNGICLCKLHHWAFDAALYVPIHRGGEYSLRFTALALESFDASTLDQLGANGAIVPEAWMPALKSQRPSVNYLDLLYADLAIEFSAI